MTHKGTVTIETERLILRRFTLQDAGPMFRGLYGDGDAMRFLPWEPHKSVSETESHLAGYTAHYADAGFYAWAIVPKESGEPVGFIDASTDEAINAVKIDYGIGKPWWRRGYTSEALSALIRFFFGETGANRICATHHPGNPNSGGVMRKCGMKYEGTLRQTRLRKGGYSDRVYYAILAEDYFGTAQATRAATAPKYVRVQTREPAYLTGKPRGIFAAVSHLERGGKLTEAELAAYHYIDGVWFEEQLPNPPFYDDDAPGKPITWFKTAPAAHMLAKLQPLMDMLDKYGTPYDVVYTNFPGRIVYEDEWQVATLGE
jgi:ribosomal-protein-alanine N-acetyltransferase